MGSVWPGRSRNSDSRPRRPPAARLAVEVLEDRLLLSGGVVLSAPPLLTPSGLHHGGKFSSRFTVPPDARTRSEVAVAAVPPATAPTGTGRGYGTGPAPVAVPDLVVTVAGGGGGSWGDFPGDFAIAGPKQGHDAALAGLEPHGVLVHPGASLRAALDAARRGTAVGCSPAETSPPDAVPPDDLLTRLQAAMDRKDRLREILSNLFRHDADAAGSLFHDPK